MGGLAYRELLYHLLLFGLLLLGGDRLVRLVRGLRLVWRHDRVWRLRIGGLGGFLSGLLGLLRFLGLPVLSGLGVLRVDEVLSLDRRLRLSDILGLVQGIGHFGFGLVHQT